MTNQKKSTVALLLATITFCLLIVPFTPITQVATPSTAPQITTPEDVRLDLEKYIQNRSFDSPLDSALAAYKETCIIPSTVATNDEGAMGVLITINNDYDVSGLDNVIDVNWKVDFGVATIVSAYVDGVDDVLAIENYEGVVTAFADSLFKERTIGVEPKPNEESPITSEPLAFATTEEISSNLVNLDGTLGTGVRIGVIDTGTDFSHPDLVGTMDIGSDGLSTSYDPTGYGFVVSLYRANATVVNATAYLAYSSWNVLSYESNGKYYIDWSTNARSIDVNNQGGLSDLDWFIDAYLGAWWGNAYPNQVNLTDYYYNTIRADPEIPDPSFTMSGPALNITTNATSGEWAMVPYYTTGYAFQQRWDPYMKIFAPVLVLNGDTIVVDWNTTRAHTDFWNLNINHGVYDFNETSTIAYYDSLIDSSFVDDFEAGLIYTPDGTEAHLNMYYDYPSDGMRFGLGTLAHTYEGNIFGLGMVDGIGLGGRVIGILYDGDSHGTFVTSQIASRGTQQYPVGVNGTLQYLPGVAPNSTIMGVSTVGLVSEFNSMLWAAGFDINSTGYWVWNSTSEHQMDITSNSWGWVAPQYYELVGQFSLLYAALATPGFFDTEYPGMIQCFSAGNSGPGYGTTTPPRAPQLINVGATTSYHTLENSYGPNQNYGQIAEFSSRGPLILGYAKPDVLAPGNSWGLVPSYGETIGIPDSSPGYAAYSGTSIACPMVAGVAALLVEAYYETNAVKATPDTIKTIIQSTADDIGMDGLSQGHGVVNASAAYDYITNDVGNLFYTYHSTENWAAATTEAWQYAMNPYGIDTYIESETPPTNFADGNLFFGLVNRNDIVTMTVDGDYGTYSDWGWSAYEYVQDTKTTFSFETSIYNETTSTGSDVTKGGWFDFPAELGSNYTNFLDASYASVYITGDQPTFENDSLWAFVFDWDDNDPSNGWPDYYNMTTGQGDELTRIQYAEGTGNVLKMDLAHPDGISNLFPNLGIIVVHDDNIWSWPYTGGNTLQVTVVTWALVENTVDFSFADNSGKCDVTFTVPASDSYGIHQGFIIADDGIDTYKLPYTYNVYATYDTEGSILTVADGVSGSWNPYEPGALAAGWDSLYTDRSADHHSFVINVTDASVNYLAIRVEWTYPDTDMDVALVDMKGNELGHSKNAVKYTDTSTLIIVELGISQGMYIVYTSMNTMDKSTIPEEYTLTFIGYGAWIEPTLTMSWYSRDSPSPTVFSSGNSIAGDHVIINATWSDVDIPELPEYEIISTEMNIYSGNLFYSEGFLVHASDPDGAYSGLITVSDYAWEIVTGFTEGDVIRVVCDFDSSDVDVMAWWSDMPMTARTFSNNLLGGDMAGSNHPESGTIVADRDGSIDFAILDYANDGGRYYLSVDNRVSLESGSVNQKTIELDTYYLGTNNTYSITISSQTGTNIVHSVELSDVFIGNFFAPEVTVYTPVATTGNIFNFTWSVVDQNADDVHRYSVWLSNDGGLLYQVLAMNLTATSYLWDSSGFLERDNYKVRIRAYSLDFNFEQDLSNPPAGYAPGDFADGFSPAFSAGDVPLPDSTPPTIDSPSDIEYDELSTGHSITWSPYDLNPHSYTIHLDDTLVQSGTWNSSSESITISVDGLSHGIYSYTVVVYDVNSNSASDTVFVIVIDTIPPIIDSPSDIQYSFGTIGHTIAWSPSDLHPLVYTIYLDGTMLTFGMWNSSSDSITVSVDGLAVGVYNYTIVVYDIISNSASDTVLVTVDEVTTTPTPTTTTSTQEGLFPILIMVIDIGAIAVIIVVIIVILRNKRGAGS